MILIKSNLKCRVLNFNRKRKKLEKKNLILYWPFVHPSPRNKIWQKKNPWFEIEVVPFLQQKVKTLLKG
jgi:uracil-DNA glycosylase